MSWSDLQTVFAVEFADQIETVASGEADSVIRERLALVGDLGRATLRQAIDQLDAASSA
jgi:hypothetical protein